jgi:type VI secretion system protein ImpE
MNAAELFTSGKLSEAITAAIQDVKNDPGNLSQRTLLFALFCFQGDLDRARKQLDVVGNQALMTEVPAYNNLITAEETRRKTLTEGLRPKFFDQPPARIEKHLTAICRLQAKQYAEAKALLDSAEEERPETSGAINGQAFDDFADADDVTRSFLEFQQGQDYYWVPFEQIGHLQVVLPDPPRPRDLYWAPCQVLLKSGGIQRGFSPVLYVGSYHASDTSLKLGNGTHFLPDGDLVYRGSGRKQFVAGEQDPTLLDLNGVSFN